MHSLSPHSYWLRHSLPAPTFSPLQGDCEVDVAIIGGGITGLTAAMHLKRAGLRVAVLEGGKIGAGTTGGSTGHLEIFPDEGFVQLTRDFGEEIARDVIRVRQGAIDQIETWVNEFHLDCDFRRVSACTYAEHRDKMPAIENEFVAARKLGLQVLPKLDAELPFPTAGAMQIGQQARFDSLRYVQGLARVVHGDLVSVYENSRAEPPRDGKHYCEIQVNGYHVQASSVVLATHSAFLGISQFDLRQAPYQSYVMAVRVADEVPDALFWDNEDPYNYIRRATSDDPHLLIIGGMDHKTGQGDPEDHFRRLESYVRQRFVVREIEDRWSAEFFEPSDGLPFIGRAPGTKHIYVATGFSGTGLTYGTAAGQILADMITGRQPDDVPHLSPSRITPLASASDFLAENLNAAYHFVADRFAAEPVDSLDLLARGEGRLVKFEGQTVAAFRDEHGEVHLLSPACTHAGCFVHWNKSEKTWDCPCHGGRFSATGERLYGPPAADLEQKHAPQPS